MTYLPERDLLVYLLRREYYEAYFDYIDLQHLKDNYKELHYVYLAVKGLREEHSEKDFELAELQAAFFLRYPDADKTLYLELFKTLQETLIDPEVGVGMLKAIKQRQQALRLSEGALRYATGYSDLDTVLGLAKELEENKSTETEEIEVVSDDLEFLINETVQKPGLRWRLQCLNKSLGSLRKANFGFIFARPETGKTTFLASEVTHMLTQLTEESGPIVWFNNEQEGKEVMLRVYQAYFGVTLEQLTANPKKYRLEFQNQVKGRFKLVDNANIDRRSVEKILEQLKPSLVIYDQIDKIKGFDADREDLRLGAIYIWARELAKTYCPAVGVCQADGSAEGQKWLTMDNVANAKTSKQAEADWILGLGKIHAEGAENTRYFNISKNKLGFDSDCISDLRHGRFEIYLDQERARYKDIIKFE